MPARRSISSAYRFAMTKLLVFDFLRVLLQTLNAEEGIVLQTVPIMQPLSVQATVRSKRHADSGHPYTHIQCNVDAVRAFMSISKYQTTANILLSALSSLLSSPQQSSRVSSESSLKENSSHSSREVERFFELSMQHFDITLVSDYIEELELFFIYTKVSTSFSAKASVCLLQESLFLHPLQNIEGHLNVFRDRMQLSACMRFEALVNNLVFRIPETFIKPTHLALAVTKLVISSYGVDTVC